MKTKQILLAIALFLSLCFSAQDKYEFMTINYESHTSKLYTSIDGDKGLLEVIDLTKDEKIILNVNPLLKKVKEYQDNGWELMSFDTYAAISPSYIAYMRKKKK